MGQKYSQMGIHLPKRILRLFNISISEIQHQATDLITHSHILNLGIHMHMLIHDTISYVACF